VEKAICKPRYDSKINHDLIESRKINMVTFQKASRKKTENKNKNKQTKKTSALNAT